MNEALTNRRQFFRVEKESTVSITVVDVFKELNLPASGSPHPQWDTTVLKNISASGVLTQSNQTYPLGAVVKLDISCQAWDPQYNNQSSIHTLAQVVRLEMNPNGRYDIGFEFLGVEPADREQLIQYLIKKNPIKRRKP